MRILFVDKVLSSNIISFNNIYTKNTHINTFIPTVSSQIFLQLEIITLSYIVQVNGTLCIIVHILF